MDNKITLEELAPYLPYGLKCQFSTGTIFEMGLFNNYRGQGIETRTIDQCLDMKPLVHPLSQLTQEIEYNGQRFVPILELANMNYYTKCNLIPKFDFVAHSTRRLMCGIKGRDLSTCQFVLDRFDSNGGRKNIAFNMYVDYEHGTHRETFADLEMIKKLHEWHFDIYGLIERDLALPIED